MESEQLHNALTASFRAGQDDEREALLLMLQREADRSTLEPKIILETIIEKVKKRDVSRMSATNEKRVSSVHPDCECCPIPSVVRGGRTDFESVEALRRAKALIEADLVWSGDFLEIKDALANLFERNLANPDRFVVELAERLTRA